MNGMEKFTVLEKYLKDSGIEIPEKEQKPSFKIDDDKDKFSCRIENVTIDGITEVITADMTSDLVDIHKTRELAYRFNDIMVKKNISREKILVDYSKKYELVDSKVIAETKHVYKTEAMDDLENVVDSSNILVEHKIEEFKIKPGYTLNDGMSYLEKTKEFIKKKLNK